MANLYFPLTGLAALGAAITFGLSQDPLPASDAPVELSFTKPAETNTWLMQNPANDTVCLITKTRRVSSSTVKIDVDPTCADLLPGGLDAQVWQEDEQGNIYLGDERGATIAEFAPAVDAQSSQPIWKQDRLTLSPLS